MGVLITKDHDGIVFHCGDGVYACDDDLHVIDQNNIPRYIAYHCLRNPEEVGVDPEIIPSAFETDELRTDLSGDAQRIMIASDGFDHHNEQKLSLSRQKHPELPPSLHGQQWGKTGNFGLKKWMNSRSDKGYFEDDCFIITVERLDEKNDSC
jgi:hypothetical protein